jgi:hypothetical protein
MAGEIRSASDEFITMLSAPSIVAPESPEMSRETVASGDELPLCATIEFCSVNRFAPRIETPLALSVIVEFLTMVLFAMSVGT